MVIYLSERFHDEAEEISLPIGNVRRFLIIRSIIGQVYA